MTFKPKDHSFDRPAEAGVEYGLYFIDGAGHITHSHEFTAKDDVASIKIAEGWREGRKMELWQRTHVVKRWD